MFSFNYSTEYYLIKYRVGNAVANQIPQYQYYENTERVKSRDKGITSFYKTRVHV